MSERDERPEEPAGGQQPPPDEQQWREFQEFKRFQEFLRYSQATGTPAEPPPPDDDRTPPSGTEIQPWTPSPPAAPPAQQPPAPPPAAASPQTQPAQPELHHQLSGMQHQLAELTEAQRAAKRAANPPLWRKLLRSKLLRTAIIAVVLLVTASLVLPELLGPGGTTDIGKAQGKEKEQLISRAQPLPQEENRQLFAAPRDGVRYLYELTASGTEQGVPATACLAFDSEGAAQRFAEDLNQPDCASAIRSIADEVRDPLDYADPTIPARAERRTGATSVISSCASRVAGGPRLGEFTLSMQRDQKWVISGHRNEPNPCPATSSETTPSGTAPSN